MGVGDYKIVLDEPSTRPGFGFDRYADALRQIIEGSRPCFVVGIFGGWGSGKTTLMRAVQACLNKERTLPVYFNAWRYEREQHLVIPLLDCVREALIRWGEENPSFSSQTRKAAAIVGKVLRSLVSGFSIEVGLPGALGTTFNANESLSTARDLNAEEAESKVPRSFYHASFVALKEAFAEFSGLDFSRRIVVFIDDLDRCLPERVIEMLESIKLFLGIEGFVFVVGLDRGVAEWCVDMRYRKELVYGAQGEEAPAYQIKGRDYVKKIFQIPFVLRPVPVKQLDEFLERIYDEADLPDDERHELRSTLAPHLRVAMADAGINPREVKRYINAFILAIKINPDLRRDTVLALQAIAFRPDWGKVEEGLLLYGEIFTNAVLRQLGGDNKALEDLDHRLANLPQTFLTYVSEGSPGNSLLHETSLDEYLYNAEAVRPSFDPLLLEYIREAAGWNGLLRGLEASADPRLDSSLPTRLEESLDVITRGLTRIPKSAWIDLVQRDIEDVRGILANLPSEPSEIRAWAGELRQRLGRIQVNLVSLHRSGML